jgi:hypothetical protein
MEKDPGQMHNMADDPAYADVVKTLGKRMEAHLREYGDPRALGKPLPWGGLIYLRRPDLRNLTPEFWVPFYQEHMVNKTYEENCALLQEEFGKSRD